MISGINDNVPSFIFYYLPPERTFVKYYFITRTPVLPLFILTCQTSTTLVALRATKYYLFPQGT